MFDTLLGRKFTVRCKQAIKCISKRLTVIRKRRVAMINFLRQDIADLLRDGHESNALSRMDALMVEINHLACYDLIAKFCESILKRISVLQKQRDCPAEDKESISTLIFAAARFSDLPELCDLRHRFVSRYGSAMETFVNLEIIEKLASRTFPMATKVLLMQKIAQELSVAWLPEPLEDNTSDSTASQFVIVKDREKREGSCRSQGNSIKDVVIDTEDIHAVGSAPDRRKSSICEDELEHVNPCPAITIKHHFVYPKLDKDCNMYVPTRAREVLDPIHQEGKVKDEKLKDGVGLKCSHDNNNVHGWSTGASTIYGSRKKHVDGKHEVKNRDKSVTFHLIRPKDVKDAMNPDENRQQGPGEDKFVDNAKPNQSPLYLKPRADIGMGTFHLDGYDQDKSPTIADNWIAARERRMDGPWKSNHEQPLHMIPPPYVKPRVSAGADPEIDGLILYHERLKPVSVRRNNKSPAGQEPEDDVGSNESLPNIQPGQKGRVARKNQSPHQDEYDSEEENIDRLLAQYSKKKTPQQSRKRREKTEQEAANRARKWCEVELGQTLPPSFPQDSLAVEKIEDPARTTRDAAGCSEPLLRICTPESSRL